MVPTAYQQQVAAESLYRDANSLLYADNKPTDEAIDRVIGKINQEYVAGLNAFPALHLSRFF
jgi:pre-mRNA-splicing factor SYF2